LRRSTICAARRQIGICSQVNTHVFVDGAGEPVRPAITWHDGRAAPDATRSTRSVSPAQKLDWSAGRCDRRQHALSRIASVARTEPGDTRHAARVH